MAARPSWKSILTGKIRQDGVPDIAAVLLHRPAHNAPCASGIHDVKAQEPSVPSAAVDRPFPIEVVGRPAIFIGVHPDRDLVLGPESGFVEVVIDGRGLA